VRRLKSETNDATQGLFTRHLDLGLSFLVTGLSRDSSHHNEINIWFRGFSNCFVALICYAPPASTQLCKCNCT